MNVLRDLHPSLACELDSLLGIFSKISENRPIETELLHCINEIFHAILAFHFSKKALFNLLSIRNGYKKCHKKVTV